MKYLQVSGACILKHWAIHFCGRSDYKQVNWSLKFLIAQFRYLHSIKIQLHSDPGPGGSICFHRSRAQSHKTPLHLPAAGPGPGTPSLDLSNLPEWLTELGGNVLFTRSPVYYKRTYVRNSQMSCTHRERMRASLFSPSAPLPGSPRVHQTRSFWGFMEASS